MKFFTFKHRLMSISRCFFFLFDLRESVILSFHLFKQHYGFPDPAFLLWCAFCTETHSLGSDSSRHSLLPFALSLVRRELFCFSRYVTISFESAFYFGRYGSNSLIRSKSSGYFSTFTRLFFSESK